jgi:sugar phosphate isomerase/epimerase
MKLGFLTAPLGNWPLDRIFEFAHTLGYEAVEILPWPGYKTFNPKDLDQSKAREIKATAKKFEITISALTCHVNHLDPDKKRRKEVNEHYKNVLENAAMMGVPITTATSGTLGPEKTEDQKWEEFEHVMGGMVDFATDCGVKIAIEVFPPNIVFNVPTMEKMFKVIPSRTLGINFDPSHMVWQGIDYIEVVERFHERIYHTHAKDTEIRKDILKQVGILGRGWWRFRIPGCGEVDWKKLITTYRKVKYDNVMSFEHEDSTVGKEEGIKRAIDFLGSLVSVVNKM